MLVPPTQDAGIPVPTGFRNAACIVLIHFRGNVKQRLRAVAEVVRRSEVQMKRHLTLTMLFAAISLSAAVGGARAADPPQPSQVAQGQSETAPRVRSADPSSASVLPTAHTAVAKRQRLKFRGPDGTCACTCASGGTTEAAIQQAQEMRERASP